jgi:hypothetical protein
MNWNNFLNLPIKYHMTKTFSPFENFDVLYFLPWR